MRFLPRTVQQLVTTTPDAQRVRDGLTAAVQPTLNFLNSFFQSAPDGSLQVTKPTTFQNAVSINGNASAPSFVSSNGFRSYLDGGTVSAATGATATYFQHQRVLYRGGNLDQQNLVQPMGFAGSVVGIMAQYQGSTSGQSINIKVQKNNADLWTFPAFFSSASAGALGVRTVAKGTYPFAPQEFLTVLSSFSAGGDLRLQVTLIVETAA